VGKHKKHRNRATNNPKLVEAKVAIASEAPKAKLGKIGKWLLGAVSLLVTLSVFWPRPTIAFSAPSIPDDPYTASVTLTNSTLIIPLHDVTAGVGICQSVTEPQQFDYDFHCNTERLLTITVPEWSHLHLAADESLGIPVGKIIRLGPGTRLSGADLAIKVSYHWWFVPITFHRSFRFVTRRDFGADLHWYARPVEP
jgi:hypothetical protein